MKVRIALETLTQVRQFCRIMQKIDEEVYLTDGAGLRVNAKSFMGVAYTLEFNEIWLESEKNFYSLIAEYVY